MTEMPPAKRMQQLTTERQELETRLLDLEQRMHAQEKHYLSNGQLGNVHDGALADCTSALASSTSGMRACALGVPARLTIDRLSLVRLRKAFIDTAALQALLDPNTSLLSE